MHALAAAVLALCPFSAEGGGYQRWPPLGFSRGFFPTDDGAIHYVTKGSRDAGNCLLFVHGNPRSTDEWREIMESAVCASKFCVAVDFLGSGHSDDPRRWNVTHLDYARYFHSLLLSLGQKKCGVMGSLTGVTNALILATEFPETFNYFIGYMLAPFLDDGIKTVQAYIESCKHFVPAKNGSHLIDAWNQRSYAPVGGDVWLQERSKTDMIHALPTQWPIMQTNLDSTRYDTGDLLPRAALLKVPTLLMYGMNMVEQWDQCPPCFNFTAGYKMLIDRMTIKPAVHWIAGAAEVAMNENATDVVHTITQWYSRGDH
eukprot:TRINITY_DN24065_c0_g1_i1.p1 TRINITY_DN24065_c0_g1~~TRINITY_DN24065_c0_g1_i1.p1  ORF type:complete len:315 (+),score=81.91 TRINITY_DN24065_c0_g1_i1:83-1027(+)